MPAPPIISTDALNMATQWVSLTDVAFVYGWLYFDMVVHELGHCCTSLVLGGRMIGVRFGKPVLLSLRGKRVRRWMVGLTFFGGASIQADRPTLSRKAQWLVTVAGPTASAGMGVIFRRRLHHSARFEASCAYGS